MRQVKYDIASFGPLLFEHMDGFHRLMIGTKLSQGNLSFFKTELKTRRDTANCLQLPELSNELKEEISCITPLEHSFGSDRQTQLSSPLPHLSGFGVRQIDSMHGQKGKHMEFNGIWEAIEPHAPLGAV